jgi:hypothetical protein
MEFKCCTLKVNDLPSVIPYTVSNENSSVVLFAGDTSVIISEPCSMNFDKTFCVKLKKKNKCLNKINI